MSGIEYNVVLILIFRNREDLSLFIPLYCHVQFFFVFSEKLRYFSSSKKEGGCSRASFRRSIVGYKQAEIFSDSCSNHQLS